MKDKLAMQDWERIYVYRAWPNINHPDQLQQEGRSKRLPFIETGD